jgi:hypothetical protein
MRMDLWHRWAAAEGALPAGLEGASAEEVEDRLGFGRSARYRARVRFRFPEGWEQFRAHLATLGEFARGRAGVIIGASDNVMPGASWERLRAVSGEFCRRNGEAHTCSD